MVHFWLNSRFCPLDQSQAAIPATGQSEREFSLCSFCGVVWSTLLPPAGRKTQRPTRDFPPKPYSARDWSAPAGGREASQSEGWD